MRRNKRKIWLIRLRSRRRSRKRSLKRKLKKPRRKLQRKLRKRPKNPLMRISLTISLKNQLKMLPRRLPSKNLLQKAKCLLRTSSTASLRLHRSTTKTEVLYPPQMRTTTEMSSSTMSRVRGQRRLWEDCKRN
jgi:hypothetical protein